MKRLHFKPSKISLGEKTKPKNSKPLHEMGISIKVTPFQNIVEGVKYLLHDFPRVKTPLQQEHYSQEEDMSVPFSRRDQEKRSLIHEAYSIDEEKKEEELQGSSIVVTAGRDIFYWEMEMKPLLPLRGLLYLCKKAPRILHMKRMSSMCL